MEDVAESMGSTYTVALGSELERKLGKSGAIQTGNFGELGIVSFNGNNVLERVRYPALCNKAPKMAA